MHHNDRRYYEPTTGRYLTRDPLGLEGGAKVYLYARHNPNRLIDPTGEIIPCLAANYLRCLASCALLSGLTEFALNCGNVDIPTLLNLETAVDHLRLDEEPRRNRLFAVSECSPNG